MLAIFGEKDGRAVPLVEFSTQKRQLVVVYYKKRENRVFAIYFDYGSRTLGGDGCERQKFAKSKILAVVVIVIFRSKFFLLVLA